MTWGGVAIIIEIKCTVNVMHWIILKPSPAPNLWKDWCWGWSSNTLATWCKESTHWKRPWCWERLKEEGEGGGRGWDGITASMDMSLSKLWEIGSLAAVHVITQLEITQWLNDGPFKFVSCSFRKLDTNYESTGRVPMGTEIHEISRTLSLCSESTEQ